MKVAISLPDRVFSAAEKLAQRLRVSRSQLYAQALEEYLARRQDSHVTECLDAVYATWQELVDPALSISQLEAVGREAW
jgi:metal-responsive CopG/Arc/MetJ family transcriptional regulator